MKDIGLRQRILSSTSLMALEVNYEQTKFAHNASPKTVRAWDNAYKRMHEQLSKAPVEPVPAEKKLNARERRNLARAALSQKD